MHAVKGPQAVIAMGKAGILAVWKSLILLGSGLQWDPARSAAVWGLRAIGALALDL